MLGSSAESPIILAGRRAYEMGWAVVRLDFDGTGHLWHHAEPFP